MQLSGVTPEWWVLLAGLVPAVAVYGLHWRRGYFLDDPFMDALSFSELLDTGRAVGARPLGTALVGVSYLIGEPAGRVLSAVALLATALLAGLLVRRTCGGRYGPVVAALLIVYPLLDWESALYWYAAIQYPAGAAFGLAGGHEFLSTIRARTRRSVVVHSTACAVLYGGSLACIEVGVNFLLLIPGLLLVEMVRTRSPTRPLFVRAFAAGGAAVAFVGIIGAAIYGRESEFTSARGEFLLNPADIANRLLDVWLPGLRDVAVGGRRREIHATAFELGLGNLSSGSVAVIAVMTVLACAWAIWRVVRAELRSRNRQIAARPWRSLSPDWSLLRSHCGFRPRC
jgi:hypothetical protein